MPDDKAPGHVPHDAVAHNDRELMELLGADTEDGLARVLFGEKDGTVQLLEGAGVELHLGEMSEELIYPILISELKQLAVELEPADGDLLIWLADDGEPRVQTFQSPRHNE